MNVLNVVVVCCESEWRLWWLYDVSVCILCVGVVFFLSCLCAMNSRACSCVVICVVFSCGPALSYICIQIHK